MKSKKKLAHSSNYGATRALSAIEYLVMHYTANDGDTDEGNANYFTGANRQASAHEFVDDDSHTLSVPYNKIAWHCGSETGKYYSDCRNANSIGIEMCDTSKNKKHDLSKKTRANAIKLATDICIKFGIEQSHVLRHYDVTHKLCPAYFCGSAAKEIAWEGFRAEIFKKYAIGSKITLQKNRQVYLSPYGTKRKRTALSAAFKGISTTDEIATLKKGRKVTIKDVKYSSNGCLWVKLACGWVLVIGKKGVYAK